MWPVRRPPDCRSKVVHQGASWCTGEEKESDDDQGSCRRSKRLSVSQDIVSGPLLFSGVLTGPQVHTDWLQLRSIPCWTISAPSSSSLGDTRIPISLSTNSSSRKVTIAVHKETATIASACTPKNLQGPPLKIPKSSENVYSTVSFSANRATAKSPQTEAKRWMGTEPTGSSIWSRLRRAHPEHAKKAPTAPITIPSQGRARVQIAENWDYIRIRYKFRTIKSECPLTSSKGWHMMKINFFQFLSKDTVWWSEKRGSAFLLKCSFEREKNNKACFCPTCRENMRKKRV